jgi:hypothetical protein
MLFTIVEGSKHPTFGDVPQVDLLPLPNNVSTTAAGSSQNVGGTSSTQTNKGAHLNRLYEHLHQFKSFKETQSSSRFKWKTRKMKLSKTKSQQKQS